MSLGAPEILLILFVVLLLFGGKRLPELARSIGKGLSEFRRATQEVQREINSTVQSVQEPPPAKPTAQTESPAPPERTRPSVNAHPAAQPRTPEEPPGSDS